MERKREVRVCPAELAGTLDNVLRKLAHNPRKILKPFLEKGMTVLDFGCGPGFFSVEIARMVGENGRVIAADIQQGMLNRVAGKVKDTFLENRIELHLCEADKTGITEKVDFILAFYVVHEVPDREKLITELKSILKPEGKLLIIEPWFHVSRRSFHKLVDLLNKNNLVTNTVRGIFTSRSVVCRIIK